MELTTRRPKVNSDWPSAPDTTVAPEGSPLPHAIGDPELFRRCQSETEFERARSP